ncbi:MAG: translation initiation factor IF-2 subunit gamma, partial [Nanoarchaeota archaeon]|nr:translation initiation factor IF-2 subunit gamma [Nanoarchaeota archaeon]
GVLGGILKRGILKVGDEIEIKPGISMKKHNDFIYKTLATKILSLHKGEQQVDSVEPGASISIETSLDPFLTKADSLTGCVVSLKGRLPEIKYKIRLLTSLFPEVFGLGTKKTVDPLKTKELLMLSINTTITVGVVEKITKNEIELSLNIPIVALNGDNAGIAKNIEGHWRLIGWGEVVD